MFEYSSDDLDKTITKDDTTSSGLLKHKSARRVNAAGKAGAMARMQVAQTVKARELDKREKDIQTEGLKTMMSAMMAKVEADNINQQLISMARDLGMKQAMLDGQMAAQNIPVVDPNQIPQSMGIDPAMMGGMPLQGGMMPPMGDPSMMGGMPQGGMMPPMGPDMSQVPSGIPSDIYPPMG